MRFCSTLRPQAALKSKAMVVHTQAATSEKVLMRPYRIQVDSLFYGKALQKSGCPYLWIVEL